MKLELGLRDRICFFGDSITAHGYWVAEVFEYFIKIPPRRRPLTFMNSKKGYLQ